MGKYIHLFDTASEFNEAYNGDAYIEPWLSLTEEREKVNYNKSEEEKRREERARMKKKYLTFEGIGDGAVVLETDTVYVNRTIQYRKNGGEWKSISAATNGQITGHAITFGPGTIIELKADNNYYGYTITEGSGNETFMGQSFKPYGTGTFKVYGNIMSLCNSTDFENLKFSDVVGSGDSAFIGLFESCYTITDASMLILPEDTGTRCYAGLFYGCTGLTAAPELPATVLSKECYRSMFRKCTNLMKVPGLEHVTAISSSCCRSMFMQCTNITEPTEISVTTLANQCYESMYMASGIKRAPVLPATVMAQSCYEKMFAGCTALTSGPLLHAPILKTRCYFGLFSGCTGLSEIKCLATDISANNSTAYWTYGVGGTGRFTRAAGTEWTTGINGIPDGWTVVDV